MNKQLISILQAVVVGVVTAKILAWVRDEHPPVALTTNNYIFVPGQPQATAQPQAEVRTTTPTWAI